MTTNAKNSSSFGISSKFSFFLRSMWKNAKNRKGKTMLWKAEGGGCVHGGRGGGSDRIKLNHGSMILNVSNT